MQFNICAVNRCIVTLEGARKTPDAHNTAVMLRRVDAAAWSGCCAPVVMGYFNFEYTVLFGLFSC